jgi:nitrile hydratase
MRFAPGDAVRVLALGKTGHVRIPHYIRQRVGHVFGYCGTYLNPEDLAVGNTSGRAVDLYRVTFCQADLWPNEDIPQQDRLIIEIYDHWLAKAEDSEDAPRS